MNIWNEIDANIQVWIHFKKLPNKLHKVRLSPIFEMNESLKWINNNSVGRSFLHSDGVCYFDIEEDAMAFKLRFS